MPPAFGGTRLESAVGSLCGDKCSQMVVVDVMNSCLQIVNSCLQIVLCGDAMLPVGLLESMGALLLVGAPQRNPYLITTTIESTVDSYAPRTKRRSRSSAQKADLPLIRVLDSLWQVS